MKKKVTLMWGVFVGCLIMTVVLWFQVEKSQPQYEEVSVKVLSAATKQVKNQKNGNTYTFYEIKVEYQGQEYDLENAHNAYSYTRGKTVKAYLSDGRLFANVEGVKSSTPLATVYFVFLFGSFGMLFAAAVYTGKWNQQKKLQTEGKTENTAESEEQRPE